MLPNDDTEQDRLDLQHHIYRITLDGRLYLAPIPKDVHHVLDIGTGTGIVSTVNKQYLYLKLIANYSGLSSSQMSIQVQWFLG